MLYADVYTSVIIITIIISVRLHYYIIWHIHNNIIYTLTLFLPHCCCCCRPLLAPLPLARLNLALALGGDQLPPVSLARVVYSVCADGAALGGGALQVALLLRTQLRRK